MCGICAVLMVGPQPIDIDTDVINILGDSRVHRRGPDAHKSCKIKTGNKELTLHGCTLHFRGCLTSQPILDSNENALLWNGEVFGGSLQVDSKDNDGAVVLSALSQCGSEAEFVAVLQQIHGPWAFIYWQASAQKLWFGRDVFGRRSLLYHISEDDCLFSLASVQSPSLKNWQELPALGIYCAHLASMPESLFDKTTLYPWIWDSDTCCEIVDVDDKRTYYESMNGCQNLVNKLKVEVADFGIRTPFTKFNTSIPDEPTCEQLKLTDELLQHSDVDDTCIVNTDILPHFDQHVDDFISVLSKAVQHRVEAQSNCCGDCIQKKLHSSQTASHEVASNKSNRKLEDSFKNINVQAASSTDLVSDTDRVSSGCEVTYTNSDAACQGDTSQLTFMDTSCPHARVAILFSGGIDSLVIAALADRFVPEDQPIDLLNVAFEIRAKEQPQKQKPQRNSAKQQGAASVVSKFDVPDRETGKAGLAVLNKKRKWNFVEVNVTLEDLQEARNDCIRDLVYPLSTVLDDSIGCAIWFAARGRGITLSEGHDQSYTSSARVVLVGMGADEQLGGYSRHRSRFSREGWPGLVRELQMEIHRISARNLGRDDRIIADHGKEARFPFLDEDVVCYLNSLPVWYKANLHHPRGVGEKLLLRMAALKLGLGKQAYLPKRAIQFGSRIAKLENNKEKASDLCSRLTDEQ